MSPASFTIRDARVRHVEVPVDRPVVTAFGRMDTRHAVLVELCDADGRTGLGESWVNFPYWAPFERVVAFEHGFHPYLGGRDVGGLAEFSAAMYRAFAGPAEQSGTAGPLLCGLSAVELALYDLAARRANLPLHRFLFANPASEVRVYASGINPPLPFDLIDAHLAKGVTLFKLKLGFDDASDRANLAALRRHLPATARIAVDVNRGWSFDQALRWLDLLADYEVEWLEEPLRPADEPRLADLCALGKVPIALGENIMMPPPCGAAAPGCVGAASVVAHAPPPASRRFADLPCHILQPDLSKYTPISVALSLLPAALRAGKRIIPHFLGCAPGLAASLHFASGLPDPLCELDINPNPLRTDLLDPPFDIVGGKIRLPDIPGLGWTLARSR